MDILYMSAEYAIEYINPEDSLWYIMNKDTPLKKVIS